MREIKFRAWDKEKGKMFEPTFRAYAGELEELHISLNGRLGLRKFDAYYDQSTFPERFELMQYTGLKDTNGVDIYEGDIIRFILGDYIIKEYVEEVVYSDGAFWCGNWLLFDAKMNDDDLEVLGNLYESPELLEREAE